jgi:hypothetical protein
MKRFYVVVLSLFVLILNACFLQSFNGGTHGLDLKGWDLDETNTGLAAVGIDPASLPLYAGPAAPPDGTVIREKRIDKPLDLKAGEITIERCWIRPVQTSSVAFLTNLTANIPQTSGFATIRYCDIDGSAIAAAADVAYIFVFKGCGVIEHCNIFAVGSGIMFLSHTNREMRALGNYIHDLRGANDPAHHATSSHIDGITVRGYAGIGLAIAGNRVDCETGFDTGSLFIAGTFGYINNVTVHDNLLEGAGHNLILEFDNNGYGDSLRALDNRFRPTQFSAAYADGGPGWDGWSRNYLYDSLQTDGKGAPVAAPQP